MMSQNTVVPLYTISGIVIHGNKRGKSFGYPTANMSLSLDVPQGVYLSVTEYSSVTYHSLTFIGAAEMFNETQKKAETFILHFSEEIYDKQLKIYLIKKIRENKKFKNISALIQQMNEDKKIAEEYFYSED